MMRASKNGDTKLPLLRADTPYRGVYGAVSPLYRAALVILVRLLKEKWNPRLFCQRRFYILTVSDRLRFSPFLLRILGVVILFMLEVVVTPLVQAQDVNIQTAAGGIAMSGNKNNRRSSFGTVNGLGIGTPVAGATIISGTGGVFYTSPVNLQVSGASAGAPAIVGVFVSSDFAHPSLLQAFSCRSGCTSAANYTAISLTSGLASDTPVVPSPGLTTNQTITVFIGVFVSNQNGAAAVASGTTDSVKLTYQTFDGANGRLKNTDTLTLNNPNETLQTAVQLTLGTATGGLSISPAADYAVNYGNVNGLGIGPGAGLTTASVAGGTVYVTPYLINPEFSDFSSTTATIIVALTTNFAHPTVLQLDDSSSSGGPFTQITATPLTITTGTAASFSSITRFLGLFVSNTNNGAGAFIGSDTATLTFTMTVP